MTDQPGLPGFWQPRPLLRWLHIVWKVSFTLVSPLLFLLSIVTLIAGRRAATPLRLWLRIATISYILIFIVTLAYFVPLQDVVKGEAPKVSIAELSSMLQGFMALNYVRQAIGLLALGAALHTLGLSYRIAETADRQV